MHHFLLFMGLMNTLGAVLLMAATRETVSDLLLRRWTRILPLDRPFRYGPGAVLWTWWAAVGTAGFAWLNLRALQLAPTFAEEIIRFDVMVYLGFEGLAVLGSASRQYGPGLWLAHPLWIGQALWGMSALQTN